MGSSTWTANRYCGRATCSERFPRGCGSGDRVREPCLDRRLRGHRQARGAAVAGRRGPGMRSRPLVAKRAAAGSPGHHPGGGGPRRTGVACRPATKGGPGYYLAPPPGRGETDPRMRAFLECIPPGEEPETIVYMSTTAVYGDLRGGWATEETPPSPSAARGMRRLDAENALLSWGRQGSVPVVILRVAGIYGPGRLPIEKVREGAPVLAGNDSPFSNRIHSHDLARVCVAAARRGTGGAVYNVSDGQPGTIAQYYCAVADLLGVPRPPTMTMAEARRVMSQAMLSYLSESKRVDNRKMREELGVTLLHPTLETGLAASLDGEE